MSQPLPVFIAPLRFCEMRLTLAGTLGLDEMDRLAEFLSDREGEVVLSLSFDEDARGIPFAEMTLDARLRLVCQRCLGPWETHVRREVRLGFTRDPDAAGRIAEHGYEPAVLERNELKLRDLDQPRSRPMAVQQNRKTRSKRGMRRSHDALKAPTLSVDPTSGETHLRHHVTPDGYYRGKRRSSTSTRRTTDP